MECSTNRLRMLCLDVAITTTGYSVYDVCTDSFSFKLVDVGNIDSSESLAGMDTDSRARKLLGHVCDLIWKHRINFILCEDPPQTTYGWKMMKKEHIVGRSSKLAKVTGAVFAIVGMSYSENLTCRLINPTEWQKGGPKKSKMDSKAWSVKEANNVIRYLKFNRKFLKVSDGEHIADAINIGIHAIKAFHSKEWALPTFSNEHAAAGQEPL